MKLLSVIALGLTLIGGSAIAHGGGLNSQGCHTDHSNNSYHCHQKQNKTSMRLSVDINLGGGSKLGNVCKIYHTNVSSLLDQYIRYGVKSNGNFWLDDGHYHEFQSKMVKVSSSRYKLRHQNGSIVVDRRNNIIKVSWKNGNTENFVKAKC